MSADKKKAVAKKTEGIRVLIVDDEEQFRNTTACILNKRGFAATAVGSGIEALDEIRKRPFDVVVLDVKMPDMDGNETFREIRKINPSPEVIMLTGHGTMKSALEGLREGVFDYLTKPCEISVLARKIRDACAREKGVSTLERSINHGQAEKDSRAAGG
jgi:DNA-binding response OmpR family regulator